jgi:hypothetical protein
MAGYWGEDIMISSFVTSLSTSSVGTAAWKSEILSAGCLVRWPSRVGIEKHLKHCKVRIEQLRADGGPLPRC